MGPKQAGAGTAGSAGAKRKPNASKTPGPSTSAADDEPEEEPLVAVILADSYDDFYAPLTVDTPRCMLPLAGVPLINYSIESAVRTGVAHIYVFSGTHTQQVRDHFGQGREDGGSLQGDLAAQGIAITVIGTPEAHSEGDALRELDAKQILRSDFLLYRCDSVVTADLRPLVRQHRERRAQDKDAIMTMVCMQPGLGPGTSALQPVYYIEPTTRQVLHYQITKKLVGSSQRKIGMPAELLRLDEKSGHNDIAVLSNLVEAGVDICSIEVPPLFSENFDYQSFSEDFVPGILTSDLLESKFFVEVDDNGYGGRASDTLAYHNVSMDILRRRASPLTPGTSAWLGQSLPDAGLLTQRYIAPELKAEAGAQIGPRCLIGPSCKIASSASINTSTIDTGSLIGEKSSITGSHIHARAKIGEGVSIMDSIVGTGAVITDNVKIEAGCLIGAECIVGPDITLQAGTRVGSRSQASWEDGDDEDEDHIAPKGLGAKARGHLWSNSWQTPTDDGDDEDEDEIEQAQLRRHRCIGFQATSVSAQVKTNDDLNEAQSISSIDEDSELGDDSDGETGASSSAFSNVPGVGLTDLTLGGGADSKIEEEAASNRLAEFDTEARASMARALLEGYSAENAVLELKTLRMASNVSPRDVQRVAIETFLQECKPGDARQIQATLKRWQSLLTAVAAEDEEETLLAMQAFCANPPHAGTHGPLFVPLIKLLYNEDVVSEEAIVSWWRSKASQTGGEAMLDLRRKAADVVRYILESSDDDDESE